MPDGLPIVWVSAVVLIDESERVLLAQRPVGKAMAGLWEFPGGKIEQGETPEQALVRELKEELGISIAVSDLSPLTFASHRYDKAHGVMPLYACRVGQGAVTAREGQSLAWVYPKDFAQYAMPPADIPLISILQKWL